MKDYVIYLRKSRTDVEAELRGEGETLARHEKALLKLAEHLALPISTIYKEIVSGETIAARPMVQRLLSEVEQGIWEGVLVMEVERLARGDTIDQGIMAQAFKFSHTKIITPLKTYDPSNELDEEYFEFGLFMSRREYKTINRRIQRGRIASLQEGKYIASIPPYGYVRTKLAEDKGYTLLPHPEQADVVKLIFELYTKGLLQTHGSYKKMGMTLIARHLDSLFIPPMFKKTWSPASISDILQNPVYIGKLRWQKRREIKQIIHGVVSKKRPNAKDYLLVNGLHPALIEEAVFLEAKSILSKRVHLPLTAHTELKNPLAGLVCCGMCKTNMTRLAPNSKNSYSTLKCPNPNCNNVSSPLYLVEEQLLFALQSWFGSYDIELNYTKLANETLLRNLKIKESVINQLKKDLLETTKQYEKTYVLLEQGIYNTAVFQDRNQCLSLKLQHLFQKLEFLEKEKEDTLMKVKTRANAIPSSQKLLSLYKQLPTASAKNLYLKELLERVEYIKPRKNTRGHRNDANFELSIFPKLSKNSH